MHTWFFFFKMTLKFESQIILINIRIINPFKITSWPFSESGKIYCMYFYSSIDICIIWSVVI